MAAPFDPQVGHGSCASGEGGGAAVGPSETGLIEAIEAAADDAWADASCPSDSGSTICVSSLADPRLASSREDHPAVHRGGTPLTSAARSDTHRVSHALHNIP